MKWLIGRMVVRACYPSNTFCGPIQGVMKTKSKVLPRFLCVGFALALLDTGCAGPRPLKGGRAVTTHKPAGVIEQTLVQGENPSQTSK